MNQPVIQRLRFRTYPADNSCNKIEERRSSTPFSHINFTFTHFACVKCNEWKSQALKKSKSKSQALSSAITMQEEATYALVIQETSKL